MCDVACGVIIAKKNENKPNKTWVSIVLIATNIQTPASFYDFLLLLLL